jgi:rhodanese-related sulfurtransferase
MTILDVREREEFEAEHIPDSICCPLSQFDMLAPGIIKNIKETDVVVMCRTGNRSKMALNELKKFNVDLSKFSSFDGGIQQWKSLGHPVRGKGSVIPIMRQMQIVASSLIFMAFLGSAFIHPHFIYLALFVGGGLALAGYTGHCAMVVILQKMPWNKTKMSDPSIDSNKSCCG